MGQEHNEECFDKIFGYIESHTESEQRIFFDGQVYDAFELLAELVGKAKKSKHRGRVFAGHSLEKHNSGQLCATPSTARSASFADYE